MADNKELTNILTAMNAGSGDMLKGMGFFNMASGMESNANLMDLDAKSELADSEFVAKRMVEQGDTFLGTQVARYAKAGVTFDGSPMKVALKSMKNIRMDIMTMKYNSVKKANAIGYKALQQRMAAGRARTRGVQSMGKGVLNMVSSYGISKYGAS